MYERNSKIKDIDEIRKHIDIIAKWLTENGNPYTAMVISQDSIKITENVVSIPVSVKD